MNAYKKSIRMLLQLAVLFVAISAIDVYMPEKFLLRKPSTLCLAALALALMLYFYERIIDKLTRNYLVSVAGMIAFWMLLRGAKYIAFEESETIARHIWYLYYLPAMMIPQLSLYAAVSVGTAEKKTYPKVLRLTTIFTVILILLMLTNDLHEWAFRFQPDFAGWDSNYSRGPLFSVVYAWSYILALAVVIILFHRCRLSSSRRLIWVPIVPAAFGVIYTLLYVENLWPRVNGDLFGEFPEAVAFTVAGIWLGIITIGLIPSNTGYGKLFELSDLAAQIADRSYRVIYRSAEAAALTKAQLSSVTTVMLDDNTRLHRKAVSGGFVYWQDDITQLNHINAELAEMGEHLAEETELLRLENELHEERAIIEARSRTYDIIAAEVLPQSRKIAALCAEAERDPPRFDGNMKAVCLLGAYIKRYANLSLIAADHTGVETEELYLAISESLRQLDNMGIPTNSVPPQSKSLPSQAAVSAYALFEELLERALPSLQGVNMTFAERELKLTLEGAAITLPAGCGALLTVEDGSSYIRLPFRKEGAPV